MALFLEVIVTSVADAVEAQEGGADRLELASALEHGGLTPEFETVEQVLRAVTVPVRVMLRRRPSMSIKDSSELDRLKEDARCLKQSSIDGLVAGFLYDQAIDGSTMAELAAAAPGVPITFHRAFDDACSVTDALEVLQRLPQIDRILTHGNASSWPDRLAAALHLQKMAAPKLKIVFAAGLEITRFVCGAGPRPARASQARPDRFPAPLSDNLADLEIHVGRAARVPQDVTGHVSRDKVAALKNLLR